jgi:hypothetical protein
MLWVLKGKVQIQIPLNLIEANSFVGAHLSLTGWQASRERSRLAGQAGIV